MSIEKQLETQLWMRSSVGHVPGQVWHGGKQVVLIKPCRNWLGARDNTGYGVIRAPKGFMGSKSGVVRVHRLAKFIDKKFPVKCQVDHICRNRVCIETTHHEVLGPKTHGKTSKKDQTDGKG